MFCGVVEYYDILQKYTRASTRYFCGDAGLFRPTVAGTFPSRFARIEKSFTSQTQAKQFPCSSPLKKQKHP